MLPENFNKRPDCCGNPENFAGALDRFTSLPAIARWKALLLDNGVCFNDPLLFNNLDGIEQFKTKQRTLNPTRTAFVVTNTSQDHSLIPSELVIEDGEKRSIVKLGYRENSPIELQVNNDKEISLQDKNKGTVIPIEAHLVERNPYTLEKVPSAIDPGMRNLEDYIGLVGLDRLSVMPFDGCWNWNSGSPCLFCDYNPKSADYDSARPLTNTLKDFGLNIQRWWDASKGVYLPGLAYTFRYVKEHGDIKPHRHLLIMSGNLPESKFVWNIASDVIDTLNSVEPISAYDNYLNVCPHPTVEALQEMKKKGVKQVQYNLEVIGERQFAQYCPGKMPYAQFQEKLIEAVSIMGFGKVRSNFVLGLQPIDELLDGIHELAQHGVVADYSVFQPKKSTPLEKFPSPSMDTIVAFTKELASIYKTYNFSPIYCSLSSRSSIIHETL